MADENSVEATINAATGLLKEVPIYQDALQPAAKELGVALLTVARVVNVALAPISTLVWGYDQIKEFAANRLSEKLQQVPEENIVTPDAMIAGPALEALRYSGHKEELAEMYASLLATAMNVDTKSVAHPSFVEIIKQLSPDEAKLIAFMNKDRAYSPMVNVRSSVSNYGPGYYYLMNYTHTVGYAGCEQTGMQASYWVNLQRLGLVELRENYELSQPPGIEGPDPYEIFTRDNYILDVEKEIVASGRYMELKKGAASLTPFGIQFCDACI